MQNKQILRKSLQPLAQSSKDSTELKKPFSSYNSSEHWKYQDYLTHFMPLVSFYTLWYYQKTSGFLMFPGAIERDFSHEMSQPNIFTII